MLREILDKTAERAGNDLKDQPEVEAELRSLIGNVYWELADRDKAENANAPQSTRNSQSTSRRRTSGCSEVARRCFASLIRGREGEGMLRDALAMQRKLLGKEHPDVANTLTSLAIHLRKQFKFADAEAMARKALAMNRKLLGNDHPQVASSLLALSQAVGWQGRQRSPNPSIERCWRFGERLGNDHPAVSESLLNLAQALRGLGKFTESESPIREALAIYRKVFGDEHPVFATASATWRKRFVKRVN